VSALEDINDDLASDCKRLRDALCGERADDGGRNAGISEEPIGHVLLLGVEVDLRTIGQIRYGT
jgi:hypothetical protein